MGRHRPGSDPTDLRLLRHRDGATALVVALLAAAAAAATLAPWYEARAAVTVLDATATTTLATLAGWEAHPWTIVVVGLASAAAVAALLVAIDRPPEHARRRLLAGGVLLASTGALALLSRPAKGRFPVDPGALADLGAIDGPLPEGVKATVQVAPTTSVWLVVVAGLAVVALAALHPGVRE